MTSKTRSLKIRRLVPTLLVAAATTVATFAPVSDALAHAKQGKRDRFTVYADVIRTVPIYRDVLIRQPTQQCYTDRERYVIREGGSYRHERRSHGHSRRHGGVHGDALVGGVIGGVIGNQIGRNSGRGTRAGATIAGAIIGSAIAGEAFRANRRHRGYHDRYSHHNRHTVYGSRPVERCETVVHNHIEKRIDGYHVTYRLRGKTLTTQTRKDPGSQIAIRLNAVPVRGQ